MFLISKSTKLDRILKVLILTLLFLIIFSFRRVNEVNAVVCDLHGASTFCPVGYRTNPDRGCVAGFLPWPHTSATVHGSHDWEDHHKWSSRYDMYVTYDLRNRRITSSARWYEEPWGFRNFNARPQIDLSSCLPDPSEERITKFFITYHDASGDANILGVDVSFLDQAGNEHVIRDVVGNHDLHTCTKVNVSVTYDRGATEINYTAPDSWSDYIGQRYCDLGCKCCTPEEKHLESHHQYECTIFNDYSHIWVVNFVVPNDFKLNYIYNKFWDKERARSAQIWEMVDLEFESESTGFPPTVTVDKPRDCNAWGCDSNYGFRFNLRGLSSANGRDINRMRLNIGASTFNINISGSTATLVNTTSGNLTAQIVPCQSGSTACFSATEVLVQVRVGGLVNLSGGIQVTASATNISGESSAVFNAGSFTAGKCPVISSFSYTPLLGSNIRFNWSFLNPITAGTTCGITCTPVSSCSSPNPVNCTGNPVGSYTASGTVSGQGSYNFIFSANNVCGTTTSNTNVVVGNPWLATGFGDAYAYGGYSGMSMQSMGDFEGIPRGTGGQAYFSTYIISKLQSAAANAYPNRPSIRSYLLSNYSDNNVNLFTLLPNRTASVYDYIYNLAGKNGCFTSGQCTTTIPPQLLVCDSKKIYFVNDNLTLTNDFRSSTTVPDDACAFIVRRNVTVSSNIIRLDGFFILDGNFITNSNLTIPVKQTLVIKGGVIANNVTFNRTLSGFDNSLNPSEIIIYDPKYIDLLRDLLGEDYPSKIRELEYSNPTE